MSPYRDLSPIPQPSRRMLLHALAAGAVLGFLVGLLTSALPTVVGVMVDLLVLSLVGIAIVVTGGAT